MELGSEYNLDLSKLNIVSDNFLSFIGGYNYRLVDSGRSAIKLAGIGAGKIMLPEYICESVIACFDPKNILFYKVREDFSIDEDDIVYKLNDNITDIFVVHYYGACQPEAILSKLRKISNERGIRIIEDTTQSLFSVKEPIGDYMVASLRKWLPIANGGVIYSRHGISEYGHLEKSCDNERFYAMALKSLFLNGELDCNSAYRKMFERCEKQLDQKQEIYLISDFSKFVMNCVSIEKIKRRRRENYLYLLDRLSKLDIKPAIALKEDDVPFAFPLRVKNRDTFRQYLIDNRIYCAVHWPFVGEKSKERSQAIHNADTLISLPIDQRYGEIHIDYMADTILKYGGDFLS